MNLTAIIGIIADLVIPPLREWISRRRAKKARKALAKRLAASARNPARARLDAEQADAIRRQLPDMTPKPEDIENMGEKTPENRL